MNKKSSNKIIQSKMKDMEVSDKKRKKTSFAGADSKKAIQQSPPLSELQKKYMNPDDGYQPDAFAADAAGADSKDDVDVKIITPKKKGSDSSKSTKDRTVILSSKKGLLGSQG